MEGIKGGCKSSTERLDNQVKTLVEYTQARVETQLQQDGDQRPQRLPLSFRSAKDRRWLQPSVLLVALAGVSLALCSFFRGIDRPWRLLASAALGTRPHTSRALIYQHMHGKRLKRPSPRSM